MNEFRPKYPILKMFLVALIAGLNLLPESFPYREYIPAVSAASVALLAYINEAPKIKKPEEPEG
jgi:hypothetical protein